MIEQDEAAIVSENEAYEAPTLRTLGTIGEVTKGGIFFDQAGQARH
jgi:hypothetical protein